MHLNYLLTLRLFKSYGWFWFVTAPGQIRLFLASKTYSPISPDYLRNFVIDWELIDFSWLPILMLNLAGKGGKPTYYNIFLPNVTLTLTLLCHRSIQMYVLPTHSIHQVIHTREVCSHADLVFVHSLVTTHGVESWSTFASLQNIFKSCLKQTVAHLVSKEK